MSLSVDTLTPAQLRAVKWLWRHYGRILTPPNKAEGLTLTMTGVRRREPVQHFVWKSTFRALSYSGWLDMVERGAAWELTDAARAAVIQEFERARNALGGEVA